MNLQMKRRSREEFKRGKEDTFRRYKKPRGYQKKKRGYINNGDADKRKQPRKEARKTDEAQHNLEEEADRKDKDYSKEIEVWDKGDCKWKTVRGYRMRTLAQQMRMFDRWNAQMGGITFDKEPFNRRRDEDQPSIGRSRDTTRYL